jgi:hypothetical protein
MNLSVEYRSFHIQCSSVPSTATMTGSSSFSPPVPLLYSLDRLRENLVVWLWMGSFFFIICGICDAIPMHLTDCNDRQQHPMVLAALEDCDLLRKATWTVMPPLKTIVEHPNGLFGNDENRTDAVPQTHFLRGRKRQQPPIITKPRQRGRSSKLLSSWQPTLQEEVWALDLLLPSGPP